MPTITYKESEILERGKTKKPVNKSGNIYVGREHTGKNVEWIIFKEGVEK